MQRTGRNGQQQSVGRWATTALAGGIALALAGGATASDKEGASPTPPPMTGVTKLEMMAVPYVQLRQDVAAVEDNGVDSKERLRDAHHLLSYHDPSTIGPALVAYAAMVAADSEVFAASIEERVKKKKRREAFLEELALNPAMVRDLPGADQAINDILDAFARDSMRIGGLGQYFIDQGYSLQQQRWARERLTGGMTRVDGAAKWVETRDEPAHPELPRVLSEAGTVRPNLASVPEWAAAGWADDVTRPAPNPRAGMMMSRALVLAARYVANDLGEEDINVYAINKPAQKCFSTARLQLNACISATRTPFEEAFCIGTHGLNDVSRCVGWASNTGAPK